MKGVNPKRTGENLTGPFAAGLWNEVARGAISSHGLSEAEAARVLALMHMVSVDATIACHDSKYAYWVPRPTQVDPGIRLAIGVPNHPSYPSNRLHLRRQRPRSGRSALSLSPSGEAGVIFSRSRTSFRTTMSMVRALTML
jgi:hypothetical protein